MTHDAMQLPSVAAAAAATLGISRVLLIRSNRTNYSLIIVARRIIVF